MFHFHQILLSFLHSMAMSHQNSIASLNSLTNALESSEWIQLKTDLKILVVTKLSILDIRRLALTCKYFHYLLSDPSFSIEYDRHAARHPDVFRNLCKKNMYQPVLRSRIWHEGRHVMFSWKNLFPYHLRRPHWSFPLTVMDSCVLGQLRCLICYWCLTLSFPMTVRYWR